MSPHVDALEERICVAGRPISAADLTRAFADAVVCYVKGEAGAWRRDRCDAVVSNGVFPIVAFAMDTAQQGMQNHANAAGAINSAISGEMQSRVAQEREKRRMEHEKYLANMRVQMAQKEQEGNIIRSLLNG
jgi:folylpolyglutamate synthase/dihydropteroate synthase